MQYVQNMKWPSFFTAKDSKGNVYRVAVEAYIRSVLGMGFIDSDIPEQPKTLTELWDLRQKGYIIQEDKWHKRELAAK